MVPPTSWGSPALDAMKAHGTGTWLSYSSYLDWLGGQRRSSRRGDIQPFPQPACGCSVIESVVALLMFESSTPLPKVVVHSLTKRRDCQSRGKLNHSPLLVKPCKSESPSTRFLAPADLEFIGSELSTVPPDLLQPFRAR